MRQPARILALANQKGGVAKTTTTLNLGVALRERGYRVLAVDLDPQSNLSMSQGIDVETLETTMYDVMVGEAPMVAVIWAREGEAVDLLEASFGPLVFRTRIGKTIRFAEAPVQGSSVLTYEPAGQAARWYRSLAAELTSPDRNLLLAAGARLGTVGA